MTDLPSRGHFSPFREPAPDLKKTEADAGGMVFSGSFNGPSLTTLNTSSGLCNTDDLDHGISEDHDDLLTLEELLPDVVEIRKSERAGLSGEHKKEHLEYATKGDSGGVTSPKSRRGEDTDTLIVLDDDYSQGGDTTEPVEREAGGSNVIHPSDGWTSKEKGGSQSSLSTPPTSVASSEAGSGSRSPLDNTNIKRRPIQMPNPPREE
ncbi:MAG: hypothetical protein M1830_002059 [Pleopsidium flavum]|nr:MAG: hypothetical protein M1830_002059 [Pleopsidium flavum]